jgi:predicted ATPase
MQIEGIEIKNYRLFRNIALNDLPRMAVVVGANGSGKSTLFDVFTFLKDALAENVAAAVARRGGFRELVSRDSEGPIEVTIKFRESGGRLVTYHLAVGSDDRRVVVEREVLRYRRGQRGQPWRFVDFSRGEGKAITNESAYGNEGAVEERMDYALDDPSILAIKGLGQFREFRVVSELRSLIENWYISDFHIADARPSVDAGYAEHLSTRGDNVALVAQYLYESHHDRFDQVLKAMSRRVPGVSSVEAKPTDDGRLVLRFQDGAFKDPFIARYVSDGTIKMFAYLVLLYDPKPHPLLAIEEPENQLYPHLLWELAEEFRGYACRGGQVFVSTHSPEFLNGVKLDEVFCLVKTDGFTKVFRPSTSETLRNLVNGGELPGRLWKQVILEGVV